MRCVNFTNNQPVQPGTSESVEPFAPLAAIEANLAELLAQGFENDLTRLGDLHTAFEQLSTKGETVGDPHQSKAIVTLAGNAMRRVEKVMLNDVPDAPAAMQQLATEIAGLQAMLSGVPAPVAIPTVSTAASAAKPVEADAGDHGVHVAEQQPLSEHDLPLVREFITEASGHVEAAEAGLLQLEEDSTNVEAINAVFRGFHTIKGVAGFLNLTQIGALAHAAENVLDLARQGNLQMDSAVADTILGSIDAMRKLIGLLGPVSNSGGVPAPLDGLTHLLARLHACAKGEAAPASAGETPRAATKEHVAPAAAANESQNAEARSATPAAAKQETAAGTTHNAAASDTTVKVSTERLDALINTVGELVIAQSMVAQDMVGHINASQRLGRNMGHLGKITRELQELSMSMRMVPIAAVFQKMSRLVRDVARKAGKEINLVLTGKETELDRNVVEAISDPLVHMVRNAADHGVESPDVREANGKPRVGTIELKAYHQSGNVVIEIIDDGKGLDKARILKKAIANGIVEEGAEMSDQDIFKLVFHAGLSTAEKITDISGRGVGMDVVKKNVEALRGRIDIASTPGKGSTFSIRLPLTLAVIDGLVVKVGPERYILPITSIEQSIRPKPEQLSTVQGRGELCLIRGQTVPLYRLHRIFNVKPKFEDASQSLVVIVQDNDRRCCLLVDELLGQEQVVIKSLGEALGSVPGTSGGAILGDGNVSLILDVPGIMDLVEKA